MVTVAVGVNARVMVAIGCDACRRTGADEPESIKRRSHGSHFIIYSADMGRPRPPESGLDRGVPKPLNKKRQRLSDGAAAARKQEPQQTPQQAGGQTSCPVVLKRALARAMEAQQRTLCVLLSDAPDAGTIMIRHVCDDGWDDASTELRSRPPSLIPLHWNHPNH